MKVAIVYDRANKIGGAERILSSLQELFPDAVLYTAVLDLKKARWVWNFKKVEISFLRFFPFSSSLHELFPVFTAMAFECFDFTGFDLVISVTSFDAKAIITKPDTLHLSICLTPARFLWSGYFSYLQAKDFGPLKKIAGFFLRIFSVGLRIDDQIYSRRPDKTVAISRTVQERIKKFYKIDSQLVYPPVDTDFFCPAEKGKQNDYFLIVSRLVDYKNIKTAIEAFNQTGHKLVIIGEGRQKKNLMQTAGKNIVFVGELTDKELLRYYQNCKALIFPGIEDFGITSVEAQACGRPVVGLEKGGLVETVINGKTGLLYSKDDAESLRQAIKDFEKLNFSETDCRNNAKRFTKKNFQKRIKGIVEKYVKNGN